MLEIVSPRLKKLLSEWEERRRGRDFPARADFDPLAMKYILGNLTLIDVLYDPLRFRFRVHASNINQRLGVDMTGKFLDSMTDLLLKKFIHSHLTEVMKSRAPVLRKHRGVITDKRFINNEALVLPLSSDGRTIDMLMVGVVWDAE